MCEVERADVSSPHGGAHFYSGNAADGTRMRDHAERHTDGVTSVTLEQTRGGREFEGRGMFRPGAPVTQAQANRIWRRLSERYAEEASGEATAWVHDSWSGSVWLTVECPALERNAKVSTIRVVGPPP